MSLTCSSPVRSVSTMRSRVGSARVSNAFTCMSVYMHKYAYTRWVCQPRRLQLGGEGGLHRRPCVHAVEVAFEIGPAREIEFAVLALRPAQDDEQISVGDREVFAHQVFLALELTRQPIEASGEVLFRDGLVRVRRGGAEQRAESLVQLGGDEIEPLLQAIALHRSRRRRQPGIRMTIRNVLHDGSALGQHLPIIELERRDISL